MRAGVTRYVVRNDKEGNPRVIPANQIIPYKAGETLDSMEQRVVKELYGMECRQDPALNRLKAEFGTTLLRKAFIEHVERDNAFDTARQEAFKRARGG
jgi:hypothetical protein